MKKIDWIAAALAMWLFCGILADGWAHNHIHVESFFTPWHAILYTGYLANAAFFAYLFIRGRRNGLARKEAVPAGYRLAALGAVIFGFAGIADMTWHLIFGIEVSVSAGFSPPHLAIMIAIGLIVSGPFVAAWRRSRHPDGWSEWLPVLLSVTLGLSLMSFVTQYLSPLVVVEASITPLKFHDQAMGAASVILQAVVLMGWILIAIRRWPMPRGGLALIMILNAIAMTAMRNRFYLIPPVVLAGIGTEILARMFDPSMNRRGFHLFAFAVPVLYYLLYFSTVWIVSGISWPIHLWTGCIIIAGIVSALLSYLIVPAPHPKSRMTLAAP